MAIPLGTRKPKKIVWINEVGDSSKLNSSPWQNKDIQYRYTVESYGDSDSNRSYHASSADSFSKTLALGRVTAAESRLQNLKNIERKLNELASKSLFYEPILRGLAKYGFPLNDELKNEFIRYDINPMLQYERLLLETCDLWGVASNKPSIVTNFSNDASSGVGLKHNAQDFMRVDRFNSVIRANEYWHNLVKRTEILEALSNIVHEISSKLWVKLNEEQKKVFAVSFIDNIHSLSSSGVKAGVFRNFIEDETIAHDEKLRSAGSLLHNCYVFGERVGLQPNVPLPEYDIECADRELVQRHENVTMPMLCSYISNKLTREFYAHEAITYFSELSELMKGITVAENVNVNAHDMLDSSVVVVNKLERVAVIIVALFESIRVASRDDDELALLLKPVAEASSNYTKVAGGSALSGDIEKYLGSGFNGIANDIEVASLL